MTLPTIPDNFGAGGANLSPAGNGEPSLVSILQAYRAALIGGADAATGFVADTAALQAIAAANRYAGMERRKVDDGRLYRFHATSTATDATSQLVITPTAGSGRWLLVPGMVDLALAFTFATADAAVLFTMPVGARLWVARPYWEIATSMTGGSSSAIGLSSGQSPHNTKGDLLGGAAGDVAAGLTAGVREGTIGADIAAGIILEAASTILFDRITSVFTAGAGNAHVQGLLLKNPGV